MKVVDERAFRARPAGRMVVAPCWVYGSPDGALYFSVVRGAVDEEAVRSLVRLWGVELATGGHLSLCDVAGVSSIAPAAFAALGEFLAGEAGALARCVRRQAIVR